MGQNGFSVGRDDADVAAVFTGTREDVAIGNTDEQAGLAGGAGNARCVQGDLLALGPVLVPPGIIGVQDAKEQEGGGGDTRGGIEEAFVHE